MWKLGCMAWRIGDLLDIRRQIAWIANAGFESVSFHASAGIPGVWSGADPSAMDAAARTALRGDLAAFAVSEIHAPFRFVLSSDTTREELDELTEVLAFAGELRVPLVTVHARLEDASAKGRWGIVLDRLHAEAERANVTVCLEARRAWEGLLSRNSPRVGITLDVGHLYLDGGADLEPYGNLGALVRRLGPILSHVHLHDVVDGVDHCEVGAGCVDLEGLFGGLDELGYDGAVCLELNPDRVSPEGIRRSADRVRRRRAKEANR